MSVAIKIARTCLTSITAAISVFFVAAAPAMADAVHVEVKEGDTSFVIDKDKGKIWWVTGKCRYEIPVSRARSHRLRLEQQFRFDMVSHAPTLQVFNSVRGGWSEIPVRINDTCGQDLTCRLRMELPLCRD